MLTAMNSHIGCTVAMLPPIEMRALMLKREPNRVQLQHPWAKLQHHWVRDTRGEDYAALEKYQARPE